MNEASNSWRAPFRFTRQEEIFLFASLMLITCLFLPWRFTDTEYSAWDLLVRSIQAGNPSPLFLFILVALTPLAVRYPRARPWVGIATAVVTTSALTLNSFEARNTVYGAELARFFALSLLILSANPALAKAGDLTMRKLNSRKAEVFTHWGTVLPGIQFSAQEFYSKLENEIRERQWPGVEVLRVLYTEAGLLSHKREYFRVIRQRQVFDVCAAGFGRDYFFTVREAEIQAQLTIATVIIFLLSLSILFGWAVATFGFFSGAIGFGAMLVFGFLLLMNVLRMGLTRLDGLLMRAPVIGPIYETFFRRSTTYFQHDSRIVLLTLMDGLVRRHVDEETSEKGVNLLSCFEHQPILDGLYKTSTRPPKATGSG